MTPPFDRAPRGAVKLAAEILAAAMREDWDAVRAACREIVDQYGDMGTTTLMYGLCDSVIIRQGLTHGATTRPVWIDPGGRTAHGPDEVSPEARWAGQMLAARAALDVDACKALVDSVPDDATFSLYLSALITMSALTILDFERRNIAGLS